MCNSNLDISIHLSSDIFIKDYKLQEPVPSFVCQGSSHVVTEALFSFLWFSSFLFTFALSFL